MLAFSENCGIIVNALRCGCSSVVEHQPSKLDMWVRFPSPAFLYLLLIMACKIRFDFTGYFFYNEK